jgi:hypothetical protein
MVALGVRGASVEARSRPSKPLSGKTLVWEITGSPYSSVERARADAVEKARLHLIEVLQKQKPPIVWEPSAEYVREHLVAFLPERELDAASSGTGETMYIAQSRVEVSPARQREMIFLDRDTRAHDRLWLVGTGVLALSAVLAAVAGYVRADNATGGYLTRWLQLGVAAIAVVAAALWWRYA